MRLRPIFSRAKLFPEHFQHLYPLLLYFVISIILEPYITDVRRLEKIHNKPASFLTLGV